MTQIKVFKFYIFIAFLSFSIQIGYYFLNSKIWHPDIFSTLSNEDKPDKAILRIDVLRTALWEAEKTKKPVKDLEREYRSAYDRNDTIERVGRFQVNVGFPYLFVIYFFSVPLLMAMGAQFQKETLALLEFVGLQHSHFHKDPAFSTYFKVACLSFIINAAISFFVVYTIPALLSKKCGNSTNKNISAS